MFFVVKAAFLFRMQRIRAAVARGSRARQRPWRGGAGGSALSWPARVERPRRSRARVLPRHPGTAARPAPPRSPGISLLFCFQLRLWKKRNHEVQPGALCASPSLQGAFFYTETVGF